MARGGPGRLRRHPAPGAERPDQQGVPGEVVRRTDRRASAAGQQLPLGQLPHPPYPPLVVTEPQPVALLGDAVHTAHFSVGSGTKMAMEDAVALCRRARRTRRRPSAALAAYEAAAQPSVEPIQDAARPSLAWWEHFGRYHDAFEPWQFAYHFLSRSITDARLARRAPDFVRRAMRNGAPNTAPSPWRHRWTWPGGGSRPSPGDRGRRRRGGGPRLPRATGCRCEPHRTRSRPAGGPGSWPRGEESGLSAARDTLAALATAGPVLVAVHGGTAHTRTLLAEQARLHHGLPALLVDDEMDRDRAVTAVLSGGPTWSAPAPPPSRHGSIRMTATVPAGARHPRQGWTRCSPARASPWSAPPRSRKAGCRAGPVAARLRPAHGGSPSPGLSARYPRLDRRGAAAGPVDLAMVCVPAPGMRRTSSPRPRRPGPAPRSSAAAGSPKPVGRGVAHQHDLAAVVARTGIRLLGPNTSGFLVRRRGLTASFVPGVADVPAGRVAVVAASGGVNHALAFLLTEAGTASASRSGSATASTSPPPTYSTTWRTTPRPRRRPAHRVGRRRPAAGRRRPPAVPHPPVVALVVGRNDVGAFAASHTGALATSWRTTRAALATGRRRTRRRRTRTGRRGRRAAP